MKQSVLTFILIAMTYAFTYSQEATKEAKINSAVMAAPEDMRDGATVMGYKSDGSLELLRDGSNNLICLADNPSQKGFSVACYQSELEPFMARGRALRAEGKTFQEIFDTREKEVKAGQLSMPDNGATLSIYYGPEEGFDTETGEVTGANYRYVVYIPFATEETTGLSLKPEYPGGPWLMDPGTHRAHIMITPPPKN